MEHVKDIKALLDAAKPFIAALPADHPMAKLVAVVVDAERIADTELTHGDWAYFDSTSSVVISLTDELVDRYAGLAGACEALDAPTVDSWDGA